MTELVILLGAGRSGTKFLRDLLGFSETVSVIPFDVGYVWRYGNEDFPNDELKVEMLNDEIKSYILKTLPTLAKDRSLQTDIVLEKSVPNTLRPSFVHAVYPEAKFIHLIRDGRAVTESAMRLWQEPPNKRYLLQKVRYFPWRNYRYALWYLKNIALGVLGGSRGQNTWGPRYDGIDNDVKAESLEVVCSRQWKKCVEVSIKELSQIDQNNLLQVKYEDLMKNSDSISDICNFLNIKDSDSVIKNYQKKVVKANMEKWRVSLSPGQLDVIDAEIRDLNFNLGYK